MLNIPFLPKKSGLLGLDLSASAVKLIELSRVSGPHYRVEHSAFVPIAPDIVMDKNIIKLEDMANALRKAIRQSGTRLKNVAIALPGSLVITKIITLPASIAEDQLEQQIQLEADQYIPYALDEVALDFQVVGKNSYNAQMNDVLLAVTQRENLENRLAIIEMAGLRAEIVDVETFALENALALVDAQLPIPKTSAHTVALIDAGASSLGFYVAKQGNIIYTHEQAFGGRQLTEEIQRRYGLAYDEAILAKKRGNLPDNYSSDVLEPFKNALAKQISRLLQFYISSTAERGVDCIVLSGGCAAISGIDRTIVEQTGVVTVVANPFSEMTFAQSNQSTIMLKEAPLMMVACGLALRSFG